MALPRHLRDDVIGRLSFIAEPLLGAVTPISLVQHRISVPGSLMFKGVSRNTIYLGRREHALRKRSGQHVEETVIVVALKHVQELRSRRQIIRGRVRVRRLKPNLPALSQGAFKRRSQPRAILRVCEAKDIYLGGAPRGDPQRRACGQYRKGLDGRGGGDATSADQYVSTTDVHSNSPAIPPLV